MQRFVSRSGACVPVPSPAASLMTRWVLNSVTQLLCMGRLGPASYILLKCCAVSELLYRIEIKKIYSLFPKSWAKLLPTKIFKCLNICFFSWTDVILNLLGYLATIIKREVVGNIMKWLLH